MNAETPIDLSCDLLIVMLNYRTPDMVIDSLRSLVPQIRNGMRVVIPDNGSPDESVAKISAAAQANGWDWVSLLPLSYNGGYTVGNNAAVRVALQALHPPRYIHILNPDTLVHPDAIGALVRFLDAHPRVGIVGSRLENPDGTLQTSAFRFHSPVSELASGAQLGLLSRLLAARQVCYPSRDTPHRCDWCSGASIMIRREVFEQIGLLDEGFFIYYDEVDFCARARQTGWECWHVPASRIMHLEGQATGLYVRGRRKPYWYASRRRFFTKRYGVGGLVAADALWAAGRLSLGLRRLLRLSHGANNDPLYFARDLLVGDLKALFSGRLVPPGPAPCPTSA